MKAIVPPLPRRLPPLAVTALVLALSACVAPRQPVPAPRPAAPAPPPAAVPLPPVSADWRDAPQTPGSWSWAMLAGRSTARFSAPGGAPLAALACDRTAQQVILARAAPPAAAAALVVTTTTLRRALPADPAQASPGMIAAAVPARDPLLDALVFSRGRFLLETAGQAALYLPAWPELARVVEDCR